MFRSMLVKKSYILSAIALCMSALVSANEVVEPSDTSVPEAAVDQSEEIKTVNGTINREDIVTSVGYGIFDSEVEDEDDVDILKQRKFIASVIDGIANMVDIIAGIGIDGEVARHIESKSDFVLEGTVGDFKIISYVWIQDYIMKNQIVICRYRSDISIVRDYALVTPTTASPNDFPNWKDVPTEFGGVRIVNTDFSDKGICATRLSFLLGQDDEEFRDAVQERLQALFSRRLDRSASYTGVIFNVVGSGIKRTMAPSIYYQSGDEDMLFYGSNDGRAREKYLHAIVAWEGTAEDARNNTRVAGNPIVIDVTHVGANKRSFRISEEDAKKLEKLNEKTHFLEEGRVVICISRWVRLPLKPSETPPVHTGIVINAAGSGIKPVMAPNIYYRSGDTYLAFV